MSQPSPIPPTASGNYRILRSVPTYDAAQEIVDTLSDAGFPVEHVRVVGTGLRSVEQVTGRMTNGKAALYGMVSGAWLGLFVGLLLGLFAVGAWLSVVLWGVALGAVWGLVLGLVGHAATGGRRDFRSIQGFEADAYDVLVDAEHVDDAAAHLAGQRPTA
ncbi:general stress protein [Kocuria sp. CPCC 205292]|uniref:general stress protein n=1 Tax=Kocuria cellulosilytica TaxID=3071451 RepID=UPI0034D5B676